MHTSPRLRSTVEAAGIFLLRGAVSLVPVRVASLLGATLGQLLFSVLRFRRRRTLANLALAFGEPEQPGERRRLAARCYRHFGAMIAEFLCEPRLAGRDLTPYLELENRARLDEALAAGKGALLVTGHWHLGNWELMGSAIAALGYPFAAYVGQQHNPFADAMVNAVRRRMGMETVPKQVALRGMFRALKGRRVLTIITDQHFSRNRHFVHFFGRPVSAAPGMAMLIRHTGVPVLFAETYKVGCFRYRTRFTPLELPPLSGDEELDVLRITQAFYDALEGAVRRHPAQYFWMHRRWRTPPGAADLSPTNAAFLAGVPESPAPPEGPDAPPGEAPPPDTAAGSP